MGFGGGGGYSAPPEPTPTPTPEKPQVAKPVTEAATAARQSQKEKAAKSAGIQGSVYTTPLQEVGDSALNSATSTAGNTRYLGQ